MSGQTVIVIADERRRQLKLEIRKEIEDENRKKSKPVRTSRLRSSSCGTCNKTHCSMRGDKVDSPYTVNGKSVDLNYLKEACKAVGIIKFLQLNPWITADFIIENKFPMPPRTPYMEYLAYIARVDAQIKRKHPELFKRSVAHDSDPETSDLFRIVAKSLDEDHKRRWGVARG